MPGKRGVRMIVRLLFDEKYLVASKALIRAAKKEVYIMAYLLAVPGMKKEGKIAGLFKELLEAKNRGCDCRVIVNYTVPDNKISRENKLAAKWLTYHGIKCRYVARNRTVHAKMIIIDGVTLIIGSHNWSQRAVERNVEASLEVREEPILKEARGRFLELWNDADWMETGA